MPHPPRRPSPTRPLHRALAAALAAFALAHGDASVAAPYRFSYLGFVSTSSYPGLVSYLVTIEADNGGNTRDNQTWNASHLRCIRWSFGGGGQDYLFVQNLATAPATTATGAITTSGNGALTSVFSNLSANPATGPQGAYWTQNFGPFNTVTWQINGNNPIFTGDSSFIASQNGGVTTSPGAWDGPSELAPQSPSLCAESSPAPSATAVPVLGVPALALLGVGVAASAAWAARRRPRRGQG